MCMWCFVPLYYLEPCCMDRHVTLTGLINLKPSWPAFVVTFARASRLEVKPTTSQNRSYHNTTKPSKWLILK